MGNCIESCQEIEPLNFYYSVHLSIIITFIALKIQSIVCNENTNIGSLSQRADSVTSYVKANYYLKCYLRSLVSSRLFFFSFFLGSFLAVG